LAQRNVGRAYFSSLKPKLAFPVGIEFDGKSRQYFGSVRNGTRPKVECRPECCWGQGSQIWLLPWSGS